MQFADIGHQLRAYRLESGLRAEEIAARLGVSRAALYRYEKGEVIKLETIRRMAELLNISPLVLLGIGIDYFTSPVRLVEKIAILEEISDQLLFVGGGFCPLLLSSEAEFFIVDSWRQAADIAPDRMLAKMANDQAAVQLASRLRRFQQRRPPISVLLDEGSVRRLITGGIAVAPQMERSLQARAVAVARAEVLQLAALAEGAPMGVQVGVLDTLQVSTSFELFKARDRTFVCAAPFAVDAPPASALGVAIVTSAADAVSAHQRIAEAAWGKARKGMDAAIRLRALLAEAASGDAQ